MKLLITGCAGFIGVNFTKFWLKRHPDDTIVGVDILTYAANLDGLAELKKYPAFRFYRADICDGRAIDEIFQKERPTALVNFAAESHVDRSIIDADIFVKTNVLGTQVLLNAATRYALKRFHQISTDEVYGDLPLQGGEKFLETSPLKPSSPYSASKAAADLLALSYVRTHGLSVTVSRCSNNYGEYQHGEKFIPTAIGKALSGEKIPVYGTGENVRDWLYVTDHCFAVEKILLSGKSGEIYNIGGGCELDNKTLAQKILTTFDRPLSQIDFIADRKGHDLRYAVDFSKIQTEFGWSPQTPFEEGLAQTAAWYASRFNEKA